MGKREIGKEIIRGLEEIKAWKRGDLKLKTYPFVIPKAGGASPYSLAADLIPAHGVRKLQSGNVRELSRKAFRGSRTR